MLSRLSRFGQVTLGVYLALGESPTNKRAFRQAAAMARLEDEDGIDGPFDRAFEKAIREDAQAFRQSRSGTRVPGTGAKEGLAASCVPARKSADDPRCPDGAEPLPATTDDGAYS